MTITKLFLLISTYTMLANGRLKENTFPKCDAYDARLGECIKNGINSLRPLLVNGIPDVDLPPLDPFMIEKIPVDSSIWLHTLRLKGVIKHVEAYGFSKFEIQTFDLDLYNNEATVNIFLPELNVTAEYNTEGTRIFLIPHESTGRFTGTLRDVTVSLLIRGEFYREEDFNYLHVNFVQASIKVGWGSSINVQPDNHRLSSRFLSFLMNKVPTKKLLSILSPAVSKEAAIVFKHYINRVAIELPLDDIINY